MPLMRQPWVIRYRVPSVRIERSALLVSIGCVVIKKRLSSSVYQVAFIERSWLGSM